MNLYNNGMKSEYEAQFLFKKLFNTVYHTNHHAFYDYLVTLKDMKIRIEVKYCYINNNIGYITFSLGQLKKLISAGNFLIYCTSNKGCCWLSPKDLLEHGHLHYNESNPEIQKGVFRVRYVPDESWLVIDEPKRCKLCHGNIKVIAKECKGLPNEIEVIEV